MLGKSTTPTKGLSGNPSQALKADILSSVSIYMKCFEINLHLFVITFNLKYLNITGTKR